MRKIVHIIWKKFCAVLVLCIFDLQWNWWLKWMKIASFCATVGGGGAILSADTGDHTIQKIHEISSLLRFAMTFILPINFEKISMLFRKSPFLFYAPLLIYEWRDVQSNEHVSQLIQKCLENRSWSDDRIRILFVFLVTIGQTNWDSFYSTDNLNGLS